MKFSLPVLKFLLGIPLVWSAHYGCKPGVREQAPKAATEPFSAAEQSGYAENLTYDQSLELLHQKVLASNLDPTPAGTHEPTPLRSPDEVELERWFFSRFIGSEYQSIGDLKVRFMDFLSRNPDNGFALSRMAYINLWLWQERYRQKIIQPSATPVADCYRYFEKSFSSLPKNMVHRGFGSNCLMLSAELEANFGLMTQANLEGMRALDGLKEYAPFAFGYFFVQNDPSEKRFRVGLEMLFKVLDVCTGHDIDRANPSFRNLVKISDIRTTAYSYYCRDTYMAPHNAEGFLFAIADALAKSGQREAARIMYENTKLSEGYSTWPFRGLVEQRLATLDTLEIEFKKPLAAFKAPDHPIMVGASPFACGICHLASQSEQEEIARNFDGFVARKGTFSGALLRP